jgi:superfamily II DNA or RNA helicase
MPKISLYDHQIQALSETEKNNRVAYYLDMGLGKTFVGSEKMLQLGSKVNLIVCQKSKQEKGFEYY